GLGKGFRQPREGDRLTGATRGIGARIEIEDELAALEVGQRNGVAAVAGQGESRRPGAGREAGHVPSFRRFLRVILTSGGILGDLAGARMSGATCRGGPAVGRASSGLRKSVGRRARWRAAGRNCWAGALGRVDSAAGGMPVTV